MATNGYEWLLLCVIFRLFSTVAANRNHSFLSGTEGQDGKRKLPSMLHGADTNTTGWKGPDRYLTLSDLLLLVAGAPAMTEILRRDGCCYSPFFIHLWPGSSKAFLWFHE